MAANTEIDGPIEIADKIDIKVGDALLRVPDVVGGALRATDRVGAASAIGGRSFVRRTICVVRFGPYWPMLSKKPLPGTGCVSVEDLGGKSLLE